MVSKKQQNKALQVPNINWDICTIMGKVISQNRVEAAKWYKKAAEQENVDAQYRLGNMLFSTR